ncbi:MAG: glycosyltransferase family 4 protein [Fimbriiglobus sp.]
MKVLLNGLPALKPKTGVGYYTTELTRALRTEFPESDFTLYPGDTFRQLWQSRPTKSGKPTSGQPHWAWAKDFAKARVRDALTLHFGTYSRCYPFDIYHETNFIPWPSGLPTVLNVHDLSVLLHPEWHPADRVGHHTRRFLESLRHADRVLTISEAVRREVIEVCGLRPEQVTNIYCGISPAFRPMTVAELAPMRVEYDLPGPYFLSLGTIEPRKNLETSLTAYLKLPPEVRRACPYVLAGPWGWKSEGVRTIYERAGPDSGVRVLGYVSEAHRPALLAGAVALVYPSFYEGFGLPPVEKLASGGAVLASTAEAVREVCAEHATILPPRDVAAWHDAMRELVQHGDSGSASQRIQHAAQFTWTRAARETFAVYEEVRRERASA